MEEIPWEVTADGARARLKSDSGSLILPVLSLLTTATAKMTELAIISANFNSETAVFEYRIGVYLERNAQAEFLGIYISDENGEDETSRSRHHAIPKLCVRRARWDMKRDSKQFREAKSMQAYVKGEEQVDSQIVFITPEMFPKISLLAEGAEEMVRKGLRLDTIERTEPPWDFIFFELKGGAIAFSLSYGPHIAANDVIETWIRNWQKGFTEIDSSVGIIPDQGCFISYSHSLMERLEKFPLESFSEWKTHLRRKRN